MNTTVAVIRRRLLGLGFIVVVLSLIAASIAKYNGVFADYVPVTLRADHIGNQLQPRSDVKIRGVIVGKVSDVSTDGEGATVQLQMWPDKIDMIPQDVKARLLPKTLFGMRYVSLVIPDNPSEQSLSAGDVIPQDRTQTALQLQRVFDNLLPVLEAVRPQDIASTLNAMAQTLQGRGDDLGETLVLLQDYFSQLNTELPTIKADISELADLTEVYSEAAPDLLQALEDLTVTSRTLVEQRENLANLYETITRAANGTTRFLEINRDNIIALADTSRPTLEVLAQYAPEYPCLLGQLAGLVPRLNEALGVGTDEPGAHLTIELIVEGRGPYRPGDYPEYNDDRGPYCYPTDVPGNHPQYPPGGPFKDGTNAPPAPAAPGDQTPRTTPQVSGYSLGLPNSRAEQRFVASLLSVANGTDPDDVPGWSTLLVGPLLRGTEVSLR